VLLLKPAAQEIPPITGFNYMLRGYLQTAEWIHILQALARCDCSSPWGYRSVVSAQHSTKPVCERGDQFCKCGGCSEGVTSGSGRLLVAWRGWWSAQAVYSLSRILSVAHLIAQLPRPASCD